MNPLTPTSPPLLAFLPDSSVLVVTDANAPTPPCKRCGGAHAFWVVDPDGSALGVACAPVDAGRGAR